MKRKANAFQQVFDNRNRRVRGLWRRNSTYYAQIRLVPGQPATRIQLHDANTVPQAITAMQALKKKREDGALIIQKQRGIPAFNEMADEYTTHLNSMSRKHEQTRVRESSSVDALKAYFGPKRRLRQNASGTHRCKNRRRTCTH